MQCACAVKMTGTSPWSMVTNTSNLPARANDVAQISSQKVLNKNRYFPLEVTNKSGRFL